MSARRDNPQCARDRDELIIDADPDELTEIESMSTFREVDIIERGLDAETGIAVAMVDGNMEDRVGLMGGVKEAEEELDDDDDDEV